MTCEQEILLAHLTHADKQYQALLSQCVTLEPEYQRIIDHLSPDDRAVLERYIALCEEMDYRKLCIAMCIKKDTLG